VGKNGGLATVAEFVDHILDHNSAGALKNAQTIKDNAEKLKKDPNAKNLKPVYDQTKLDTTNPKVEEHWKSTYGQSQAWSEMDVTKMVAGARAAPKGSAMTSGAAAQAWNDGFQLAMDNHLKLREKFVEHKERIEAPINLAEQKAKDAETKVKEANGKLTEAEEKLKELDAANNGKDGNLRQHALKRVEEAKTQVTEAEAESKKLKAEETAIKAKEAPKLTQLKKDLQIWPRAENAILESQSFVQQQRLGDTYKEGLLRSIKEVLKNAKSGNVKLPVEQDMKTKKTIAGKTVEAIDISRILFHLGAQADETLKYAKPHPNDGKTIRESLQHLELAYAKVEDINTIHPLEKAGKGTTIEIHKNVLSNVQANQEGLKSAMSCKPLL
jgi:hypothetical protein